MASSYKSKHETITADDSLPGKVSFYNKPGRECYTNKHWHKNLEICYVVDGNMWTMTDNKDRDISNGDYVVINSESIHQTCGKDPYEYVKYLVVSFSYNTIIQLYPEFDNYIYDVRVNNDARIKIREILKSMVFEIENPSEFTKLRNSSYMTQIMIELITKCRQRKSEDMIVHHEDLEYAEKAEHFIRENYKEKITLIDVSDHVGLTPTYFSRYYKQATNKTFKSHLNLIRLENALLDIQNNGANESKAAINNGFPSVKSFIATFKSIYGCSPSEYAKKYHEEPPISEIRKK